MRTCLTGPKLGLNRLTMAAVHAARHTLPRVASECLTHWTIWAGHWAGIQYVNFRGLLLPDGILPGAKFTLRPSLVFSYIGSVTEGHSSSGHQPNFVALS